MLKEIVLPPIDMKKFSDQTIDSNLIIMSHDFNVNELVIPFYETTIFDTYEAFYSFQGNTSIIIQEVYTHNNEIRIPIVNDVRRHKGIFTIELNASSDSTQATLLKLNVLVKRSNIDSNSEFLFNHYYKLFEDYEKELEELNNDIQTTIKKQVTKSQERLQEVSKTLILVKETADGFMVDVADKSHLVGDTTDNFMVDVATKQADVTSKYNAFDTSITQATSDFTADVATKQADVTSKYNAFDTSVTQAGQTIDGILGLADDVQQIGVELNKKANKTQQAWITPTLLNGVTNYAAGISPVRYYKNEFNTVCLDGISSTVAIGTHIFILPVGYRPLKRLYVPTVVGNAFGWLEIGTDGSVKLGLTSPSNIYISFGGIMFRAEG